jgi:hypothetical protein
VLDKTFTIQVLAAFKRAEFDGTLGMDQMGDSQEEDTVGQIVQAKRGTIQPRRCPGVAFLGDQSPPFGVAAPADHPGHQLGGEGVQATATLRLDLNGEFAVLPAGWSPRSPRRI